MVGENFSPKVGSTQVYKRPPAPRTSTGADSEHGAEVRSIKRYTHTRYTNVRLRAHCTPYTVHTLLLCCNGLLTSPPNHPHPHPPTAVTPAPCPAASRTLSQQRVCQRG
eukprot:scaffold55147_cov57-Phaeocystis_antarctica.AAC.1